MGITTINKHLISIKDLEKIEIESILDRASFFASSLERGVCGYNIDQLNPVICNLFFEPSTRTRFSFEVAAKKLGYHVLNFDSSKSSTQKGETFYDTIKTLEAMGVNAAIIRCTEENLIQEIADRVELSLINAGSGTKEHPSQALLDLLTIREHFGKIEGLKIAIIGDIKHSRVASSNISALNKMGAELLLSGPESLQLDTKESNCNQVDIDTAIKEADVVMMLRVQKERLGSYPDMDTFKINSDDYHKEYGLTLDRANLMQKHAMIMHPAPFNRGIEIDGELVEGPRSLIYKQVSNGVATRMAILERALKQL